MNCYCCSLLSVCVYARVGRPTVVRACDLCICEWKYQSRISTTTGAPARSVSCVRSRLLEPAPERASIPNTEKCSCPVGGAIVL